MSNPQSHTCDACGSNADPVFSRVIPMGYHCPDCGIPDTATVACYWKHKICYCDENLKCDYFEPSGEFKGMCIHNLNKAERGTSREITDFCFNPAARAYSKRLHQQNTNKPINELKGQTND